MHASLTHCFQTSDVTSCAARALFVSLKRLYVGLIPENCWLLVITPRKFPSEYPALILFAIRYATAVLSSAFPAEVFSE